MPFVSTAVRRRARARIAQRVKAGEPCWLCGEPIDLTLKYPHPMSFTVDHVTPTSHGGADDYDQLMPAHNAHNRERSNLPPGSVGTNSGALER